MKSRTGGGALVTWPPPAAPLLLQVELCWEWDWGLTRWGGRCHNHNRWALKSHPQFSLGKQRLTTLMKAVPLVSERLTSGLKWANVTLVGSCYEQLALWCLLNRAVTIMWPYMSHFLFAVSYLRPNTKAVPSNLSEELTKMKHVINILLEDATRVGHAPNHET